MTAGDPVEVSAIVMQTEDGPVRHWQRGYTFIGETPINPAAWHTAG